MKRLNMLMQLSGHCAVCLDAVQGARRKPFVLRLQPQVAVGLDQTGLQGAWHRRLCWT